MLGASDLSASINKINEENNNIIDYNLIGLSYLDYNLFEEDNIVLNGKIYIDEKKQTYKLMNFPKVGVFSGYGMLNPKVYIQSYAASKRGFKGNLQGDGFQLGGTVIVDKYGNVVYKHNQKNYTDYPKEDEIIKFVNQYKQKDSI